MAKKLALTSRGTGSGADWVIRKVTDGSSWSHIFGKRGRARSAVFSSIPDAILVSGAITGEAAAMPDLEAVKAVLPDTPVLANTGVKHATVGDVLRIADGCIVGSSLKVDGNTWNPVDPERAAEFMRLVRAARGG